MAHSAFFWENIMRRVLGSIFLAVPACVVQAQPVSPIDCGPVPYSVRAKELKGGVVVSAPPVLRQAANSLGAPKLELGGEYARTMYAAFAPVALQEVLENYTCRIQKTLESDATRTPEERKKLMAVWSTGIDRLQRTAALYFLTFGLRDLTQAAALDQQIESTELLKPEESLPKSVLQAALGGIRDEDFLIASSYSAYLGARIAGVDTTACGLFVRAALAANADSIQHWVAGIKPIVTLYFDDENPAGRRSALSRLYGQATSAGAPPLPLNPQGTAALKACSAKT